MKLNKSGFTLVELLITMSVFIVVIIITGDAFNTILSHSSKLFKSEESNIEGVVGLEILRHDIQQAGFGLYTEPGVSYSEAAATPASTYNDAPSDVPRPLLAGNNLTAVTETSVTTEKKNLLAGSDYLVIKATSVARNAASQKWSYLNYASDDVTPNVWPSAAENFNSSDRVIVLRRKLNSTGATATVVPGTTMTGGKPDFYFLFNSIAFSNLSGAGAAIYTVYGLDTAGSTVQIPFNRSDYFVARPQTVSQTPSFCAPGSGILYRTTVNQSGGKLNYAPVLDCVADMQVVLGWDMDGDGNVDTYSNADGSTTTGTGSAAQVQNAISKVSNNSSTITPNIRNSLKVVKVYVLAQQGRRDPGYTSPSTIIVGGADEASLTRTYDIAAAGWLNYRWKVYSIIARPKNLPANQ